MERIYYYLHEGQQMGPYSLEELYQLNLTDSTLVWRSGWNRWKKFSQLTTESQLAHRRYYLATLTTPLGNYTLAELESDPTLLQGAELAWYQGLEAWLPIGDIPELMELRSRVTPPIIHPEIPTIQNCSTATPPPIGHTQRPRLSLWQHFAQCITQDYFTFSGRAGLREFWGFVLFYSIFMVLFGHNRWDHLFYVDYTPIWDWFSSFPENIVGLYSIHSLGRTVSILLSIFFIIPFLSVTVRRLHDTNHSAWMLLFLLLPVVGILILLAICCQQSHPVANKYGEPTL